MALGSHQDFWVEGVSPDASIVSLCTDLPFTFSAKDLALDIWGYTILGNQLNPSLDHKTFMISDRFKSRIGFW